MNTREQSAAIKKTVVENATRELVLEHACELVATFPISKEKALILSVIRSWDSLDSITKKKVNDRIKATSEVDLDQIGGSSEIDEVFSLIFQSGDKKIPDWFHLLWRGSLGRKSSDDVEPLVKAASSFYKCDQEAVSVLHHAIDSKSALRLVINKFVDEHSNQIVGCLLEEDGIPCLISSENNNLSENGYIRDALIAYHKGGIVLFPTDVVEGSKPFTRFARAFGLRYGITRGYDEDKASEELEDAAEKIRNHPEILRCHISSSQQFPWKAMSWKRWQRSTSPMMRNSCTSSRHRRSMPASSYLPRSSSIRVRLSAKPRGSAPWGIDLFCTQS